LMQKAEKIQKQLDENNKWYEENDPESR